MNPMKILFVLAGLLVVGSVAVFSQAGFTVRPPDFPTYSYQVFDFREPAALPETNQAAPPGAASTLATRGAPKPGGGASAAPVFQPADRNIQNLANELGGRGYRLVQVQPRTGGFRLYFERETLPRSKN